MDLFQRNSNLLVGGMIMDVKRKDKLIKLFDENFEESSKYYSIENYIAYQKDIYNRFYQDLSEDEQVRRYVGEITQHDFVYLGLIESLRNNDYKYLDNALYTYVSMSMRYECVGRSQYDHCIAGWNLTPIVLASNRFKDIEKIYPKEIGLSKNGMNFLIIATNLIMYLYYKEEAWKEQIVKETEKYLTKKDSLEFKSIVSALYALVNKDFEQFSLELSNICKGRKRTQLYGENKFSKEFSFYSLGLYNFANFLYPNEIEKVILPENENFMIDYHNHQKENNYRVGEQFIIFEEPLTLLNKVINVDVPPVSLVKIGRKSETEREEHTKEIIRRIMEK